MPRRASSLHTTESRLLRSILVDLRHAAGLSQSDVAALLDRPQTFVSKYEVGERRIDVTEFVQIADVFGVNPVVVLKRYMKKLGR